MATEIVQIELDAELKKAVDEIYRKKGITFADAVKIMAEKSVALGTSPFYIKADKKSAHGVLSKCANPELIPAEMGAWERATIQKYDQNFNRC